MNTHYYQFEITNDDITQMQMEIMFGIPKEKSTLAPMIGIKSAYWDKLENDWIESNREKLMKRKRAA